MQAQRKYNNKFGYVDWALCKPAAGVAYSSTTATSEKSSKRRGSEVGASVEKNRATSGETAWHGSGP
jgi:hypothetical protein